VKADLTLAEYKELRQAVLDAAWNKKWPDGMYYVIEVLPAYGWTGGVIWGHLTARNTSHSQRVMENGSTSHGFSGYYVSKSFLGSRAKSHKTYMTRDKWIAALTAVGVTL
jgi:hypothetical protein